MDILEKPLSKVFEIGNIPSDWNTIKLGKAGRIINGLTYKPNQISDNGTLVLRSSNVQNRKITFDDNVFVSVGDSGYNSLQEDDILICVRNGSKSLIGKNAIVPKECEDLAFGAFMSVYRSKMNKFLFHLFDTDYFYGQIHKNLGATINSINGSDLKKFTFPLPPENERFKIAELLSTWDQAIDKTQKLINQLVLRKKGLMQELLTGKKRLPGFDGEWKKYEIGDIALQFTDKNSDNRITEVLSCTKYDGLVRSLEYFGRIVYGKDLKKYKVVPRNYFAYATNHIEEGSIGYQNLMDAGLVSPMYTVFKTNSKVDDSYLFRLLKTDRMIYHYQSNMSGSVARRGGLRWNTFKELMVSLPPIEEQKAIATFLEEVDNQIKLQLENLEILKFQKKGLMQQLLTGKKRIKIDE